MKQLLKRIEELEADSKHMSDALLRFNMRVKCIPGDNSQEQRTEKVNKAMLQFMIELNERKWSGERV